MLVSMIPLQKIMSLQKIEKLLFVFTLHLA